MPIYRREESIRSFKPTAEHGLSLSCRAWRGGGLTRRWAALEMTPRIVGVHPVAAGEPVHLIEIDLTGCETDFSWDGVTQPVSDRDRSYWQVPWDERRLPGAQSRWAFFFHYLNLSQPLTTAHGELGLPPATPMPSHLQFIRYEEP